MNIKTILKYAIIGGLFLIPFTPLIVADSTFFPYIGGKAYYFRIIVEVITALWIILACLDEKYRPKSSALTLSVTIFTFIALLADVFGVHPIKAIWSNFERMEGWMLIVHLWLYFVVMSSVFIEKKLWYWWANVTLIASLVTVFEGFRQLAGTVAIQQSTDRIDASLGNSAYLAVYALLHAFIAGYLAIGMARIKQIVMTCVYSAIVIAELIVIYYTQTRGTLVGVALGIFVGLLYYGVSELIANRKHSHKDTVVGKKQFRNSIIALSLCAFIVIGGIVFWENKDSDFVKSNKVLVRFSSAALLNKEGQGRSYIWPMSIQGFKERPILGWGQEGFNYVFNKYYDPHMWRHEQWFDRAHNVFLDWLVAGGLLGLLSYLALYVLAVWIIVKSRQPILEKATLVGMIVAYTVHNIFVFDNISSYMMFFSILAYLQYQHAVGNHEAPAPAGHHHAKALKPLFGGLTIAPEIVYYAVIPAVVVIFGSSIYFVNIRSINASESLIEALRSCSKPTGGEASSKALAIGDPSSRQEIREQLIICADNIIRSNSDVQIKNAIYNLVANEASKEATEAPLDARGFIFAGTFLQGVGNFKEADKFLSRAMELSPQKQAMRFSNILNDLQLGRLPEALKLAQDTYNLDPLYDQSSLYYIVALIYNKKFPEAESLIKATPSVGDSQLITQAYMAVQEYGRVLPILLAKEKRMPNDIQTKVSIAALYMKQNRRAEAIRELQAISVINPTIKAQIDSWVADINAGKNPVRE